MKEVEIGKFYHFWDDGKSSTSRHYLCKCVDILTIEQAEQTLISSYYWSHNNGDTVVLSLKEIWEMNKKEQDWLYADETPYFIVISCPKYDDKLLYCAKTKDGLWFSMDVETWWQSGLLDVGEKKLNQVIEELESFINYRTTTDIEKSRFRETINTYKNIEY